MRIAWSALIVLVLLAPFGRVGITATPLDAEMVTAPRSATNTPSAYAERVPQPERAPAHGWLAVVVPPRTAGVAWRSVTGIGSIDAPWIAVSVASAQAQPRAPPR